MRTLSSLIDIGGSKINVYKYAVVYTYKIYHCAVKIVCYTTLFCLGFELKAEASSAALYRQSLLKAAEVQAGPAFSTFKIMFCFGLDG